MNNRVNMLKEWIGEARSELDQITKKIVPLEQQRILIEDRLKTLEHLISLEENEAEPTSGKLIGKSPREGYIELIKTDFRDVVFVESNLWEIAKKEGLRTKDDKVIERSYSRALIAKLVQKGFLEKLGHGKYRLREQKQKTLEQEPLRAIDT